MATTLTSTAGMPQGSGPASAGQAIPRGFFPSLDSLLRRREAFFEDIFADRHLAGRMRWFLLAVCLLSGGYGATMGATSFAGGFAQGLLQMVTSAVKVPLLYLLSVAICFPVLYIVLVLMGARLAFRQTLALILLALTLNAVLLASCAPIVVFFLVTGSDYHFIKLLHVLIFAFSGFWAMSALWHGLQAMCEKSDLYPKQAIRILQVWVLVFGFVGTQMAWSLRPFVGSPDLGYEVLRSQREGNFYRAVWTAMVGLASDSHRQPNATE